MGEIQNLSQEQIQEILQTPLRIDYYETRIIHKIVTMMEQAKDQEELLKMENMTSFCLKKTLDTYSNIKRQQSKYLQTIEIKSKQANQEKQQALLYPQRLYLFEYEIRELIKKSILELVEIALKDIQELSNRQIQKIQQTPLKINRYKTKNLHKMIDKIEKVIDKGNAKEMEYMHSKINPNLKKAIQSYIKLERTQATLQMQYENDIIKVKLYRLIMDTFRRPFSLESQYKQIKFRKRKIKMEKIECLSQEEIQEISQTPLKINGYRTKNLNEALWETINIAFRNVNRLAIEEKQIPLELIEALIEYAKIILRQISLAQETNIYDGQYILVGTKIKIETEQSETSLMQLIVLVKHMFLEDVKCCLIAVQKTIDAQIQRIQQTPLKINEQYTSKGSHNIITIIEQAMEKGDPKELANMYSQITPDIKESLLSYINLEKAQVASQPDYECNAIRKRLYELIAKIDKK